MKPQKTLVVILKLLFILFSSVIAQALFVRHWEEKKSGFCYGNTEDLENDLSAWKNDDS